MHVGITCRAPYRDDGEKAPALHSKLRENALYFRQFRQVTLVHAGHHVEDQPGFGGRYAYGACGPGITARMAAHPVVGRLQAVQADCQRPHSGVHQAGVHGFVVEPSVGDHSPEETAAADFLPYGFDVGSHERFSAGKDYREVLGPLAGGDGVQCAEEVFQRHVLFPALDAAVAAAMAAMEIAAGGALPEQVVQFVYLGLVAAEKAEKEWLHGQ